MPEFDDEVVVLSGTHGPLRWQVVAGGTSDDLMTMLQVFDCDIQVASSGFGGPPLYPGKRVNEWRGRTDDLPYFVMARVAVEVTRLVVVTDRETRVELSLGDVDPRFGVRFAAAGLPDGEGPGSLLVEVNGRPERAMPQPVPLPPQLTTSSQRSGGPSFRNREAACLPRGESGVRATRRSQCGRIRA